MGATENAENGVILKFHKNVFNPEENFPLTEKSPYKETVVKNGSTNQAKTTPTLSPGQKATLGILCYINLINYMDRFTLAGVLDQVQVHFEIDNQLSGVIQTVYTLAYMGFAPLFGYLGDRYSRKGNIAFGLGVWGLATLLGSFTGKSFAWFIISRAGVGLGQASFSTLAPTVISDMVSKDQRSMILALFYFLLPIGSGLGYIVGAGAAQAGGDWRYCLRVTPILVLIGLILIFLLMVDPGRGQCEREEGADQVKQTSFFEDIIYLLKNKSFMLSTGGFTSVAFVSGALAWWGPIFLAWGFTLQKEAQEMNMADTSLHFGLAMMLSGLIGVPIGSISSQKLRVKNLRADPLICAVGMLLSAPLLYFSSVVAVQNTLFTFLLVFFGMMFLNLCWCIVADILLYTVRYSSRSTAQGLQILISFAFGAAGSPYLIGAVSDSLKKNHTHHTPIGEDYDTNFQSLSKSLYIVYVVELLGGVFFLLTAIYILKDKQECDKILKVEIPEEKEIFKVNA